MTSWIPAILFLLACLVGIFAVGIFEENEQRRVRCDCPAHRRERGYRR